VRVGDNADWKLLADIPEFGDVLKNRVPPLPTTPAAAPAKTSGLAIASLVCSFFFWLYGIGAVLAIVFGFIARSQIKRSAGMQRGGGMALAGIIIGFAGIVIGVVLAVVIVAVVHHCQQNGNCTITSTT